MDKEQYGNNVATISESTVKVSYVMVNYLFLENL